LDKENRSGKNAGVPQGGCFEERVGGGLDKAHADDREMDRAEADRWIAGEFVERARQGAQGRRVEKREVM
jgi:hypothetical protein